MMSLQRLAVLQELPYSCAVTEEFWGGAVCFWCLRVLEAGTLLCAACRQATYCSASCQALDWKSRQHRVECCLFREASSEQLEQMKAAAGLRLIFRTLSRKSLDKGHPTNEEAVGSVFNLSSNRLQRRTLEKMMFDCVNLVSSQSLKQKYMAGVEVFRRLFADAAFLAAVPDSELYSLFHTIYPNCREICQYRVHQAPKLVGFGLYLQESQVSHSCQPTLERSFSGSTLVLRSLAPSSAPPTVCQLSEESPMFLSTDERQRFLLHMFGRPCRCPLCTSPPEFDKVKMYGCRLTCLECGEALVPERQSAEELVLFCFQCNLPRYPITFTDYTVCYTLAKTCCRLVECSPEASPAKVDFNTIINHIDMAEKIFHPVRNVLLLRLRMLGFGEAERLHTPELQKLACRLGLAIQATLEHYGLRSPAYPVLCARMARLLRHMKKYEEALNLYEKAKELWREVLPFGVEPAVVRDLDEVIQSLNAEANPDPNVVPYLNIL